MNTPEQRNDAIAGLRAALLELESGKALTRLVAGHGLMSRTFEFKWNEPELGISIRLPYARVLLKEETQAADSAEIGAAMRMSILLLETAARGALLQDGESRLDVSLVGGVARYRVLGRDGISLDGASDWDGLVARLKPAFPGDGEGVSIFLP
jgi:hypothetical protein